MEAVIKAEMCIYILYQFCTIIEKKVGLVYF